MFLSFLSLYLYNSPYLPISHLSLPSISPLSPSLSFINKGNGNKKTRTLFLSISLPISLSLPSLSPPYPPSLPLPPSPSPLSIKKMETRILGHAKSDEDINWEDEMETRLKKKLIGWEE